MIVQHLRDRIQLITQPDHARLARAIMEHCVPLMARPRRDTILFAIAEHDNGWAEEDAAPRVNPVTLDIFDFVTAPATVRHSVWPRGVSRLAGNPWAAALVAQHAIVVYDRFRRAAAWEPFFSEMEAARDSMVKRTGGLLEHLLSDYVFVRLADLISLTFCTGWTDEQRFGDWTVRLSGARVIVPDLFGGAEIPIAIDAKEIPARAYRSDAELRDVFRHAVVTTLHGTVAAAEGSPAPAG